MSLYLDFAILRQSYAMHLYQKQLIPREVGGVFSHYSREGMDYGYIEYLYKAMANETNASAKMSMFHQIKGHEAYREYYSPSLWSINHLIQLDQQPNLELKEPRWEIYKISLSFLAKRKLNSKNQSKLFNELFI